jgi:uncharacterized protein
VCSFDKRGVGGSAGSWLDAGIAEQADDLLAGLAVSARGFPVAFVITSSGPDVSPARQERYSLANKLGGEEAEALAAYDAVVAMMGECPTLAAGLERLDAAGVPYRELPGLEFMFQDEAIWTLCAKIFDYAPAPALSRIRVPVLALFGEADKVTPPEESVAAFRAAV